MQAADSDESIETAASLSRRLDRCDRVIQDESGDYRGYMCNTSQWKLRSLRVNSGMGNVICIVT